MAACGETTGKETCNIHSLSQTWTFLRRNSRSVGYCQKNGRKPNGQIAEILPDGKIAVSPEVMRALHLRTGSKVRMMLLLKKKARKLAGTGDY